MTHDRLPARRTSFRVATVLPVIIFALVAFGFAEEYVRNNDIEAQIERMQAENAALEADRLASLQLIDTLSSTYYVEGEARKSGMGKEGEQLIIVSDSRQDAEKTSVAVLHSDVPNPVRWYEYFFDHEAFLALTDV